MGLKMCPTQKDVLATFIRFEWELVPYITYMRLTTRQFLDMKVKFLRHALILFIAFTCR